MCECRPCAIESIYAVIAVGRDTNIKMRNGIVPVGKRNNALDVIRCIAIVAVVCEHTSSSVLLSGRMQLIFQVFGTLGVPLFVMLTGYLMLDRRFDREYTERYLQNNLLPLFIAAELWNILWYGLSHVIGDTPIALSTALSVAFFYGPSGNGFWYIPMAIGLYLGLPIISKLVHWIDEEKIGQYGWVLVGCALFFGTVIPTCAQFLSIHFPGYYMESVLNMNIFGADVWGSSVWMVYLLLGYSIRRGLFEKVHTGILCVALCVLLVFLYVFHLDAFKHGIAWDPCYANALLVFSAVMLFVLMIRFVDALHFRDEGLPKRVTCWVSRYSFAVYMIHFWILATCLRFIPIETSSMRLFAFVMIFGITFGGSLFFARMLYFIRPSRKWLLLMK